MNCLSIGATAHSNAYFGEGRGPIHLDSVVCSGYEISLTDCEIQHTESSQGHSLDVGVKCQPGMLKLFLLFLECMEHTKGSTVISPS